MRLDKLLSNAGLGSRQEVKKLIRQGIVTVNGEVISDPSFHVDPEKDEVLVNDEFVDYDEYYYLMLHKPAGYITSTKDKELTVMELITDVPRPEKLFPVGRLDKDAEGLLLITNDGELAHRLTHPKWKVPKTYYVIVEGKLTEDKVEPLRKGISFKDFRTKPAKVKIIKAGETESEAEIEITEGKYHQVKRMFEKIGHPVKYLKRIKFGNLKLGNLPKGEYRNLTPKELEELKKLVGLF